MRKNSAVKQPQQRPADLPMTANCKLCGEAVEPSPLGMSAHLLLCHPMEFIQSGSGQKVLREILQALFDFGKSLTARK